MNDATMTVDEELLLTVTYRNEAAITQWLCRNGYFAVDIELMDEIVNGLMSRRERCDGFLVFDPIRFRYEKGARFEEMKTERKKERER